MIIKNMKRFQIELDLFVTLIITLGLAQLLSTSSTLFLPAVAQQPSVTEIGTPGQSQMNITFLPKN
jgi:hypothetical protein